MDDYNFSWYILLAALLPALVLLYLIWKRDKYQREPIWLIVLAFVVGSIAAPLSMVISLPTTLFWAAFFQDWMWTPITCFYDAFFEAAIPEEFAKFAILWMFLRKNKYFDEYMDGIVYAAAIGLGFAGLENIIYISSEGEAWGAVAVMRALLSVPGHFAYGVVMGYYYSLWRIENRKQCLFYALAFPILFHGVYDFVLMFVSATGFITIGIVVVFFLGIHKLRKHCTELIDRHLDNDVRRYYPETDYQYSQYNFGGGFQSGVQSRLSSDPLTDSGIPVDKQLVPEREPLNANGFLAESGFKAETENETQFKAEVEPETKPQEDGIPE